MLQGRHIELRDFLTIDNIILAIVVLIGSVRFFLAAYLPIMGDGAFHAYLTESIVTTGSLPLFSFYPPTFHLNAAILALFAEEDYKFLPAIFGVLSIVAVYLFAREITESRVASLVSALFVAIFPFHLLMSSTFFMETSITFVVFLTLYCHLRFYKTRERNWLVLTGIFAGLAVALKQTGYLLPIVIVVQHLVLELYRKRSISGQAATVKQVLLFLGISALVASPFLYYFFMTTGTLTDPTNPLIQFGLFTIEDTDPDAVQLLYQSDLFPRVHFQPYLSTDRILQFYNPSGYFYNIHYPEALFLGLVLLGGLFLLWKRSIFLAYVLIFVVIFHLGGLNIIQHARHFLFLSMMSFILLSSSVLFPRSLKNQHIGRAASAGILAVILLSTSTLYIDGIEDVNGRFNSMGWLLTAEPITNLIEAYDFVEEHSDPDDVLADPNRFEAMYYANRKTFWLTPFGGAEFYQGIYYHDLDRLNQSLVQNDVKFLMIIHRFVTTGPLNTPQFIRYDDYLFISSSPLFRLAFERPGVEVYEFVYHDGEA